jgi:hypothetical protein
LSFLFEANHGLCIWNRKKRKREKKREKNALPRTKSCSAGKVDLGFVESLLLLKISNMEGILRIVDFSRWSESQREVRSRMDVYYCGFPSSKRRRN